MSINNLSLFGLVLAIGIVVDDAIVVVENTMRLIDTKGLAAKEATAKAMEEVGGPIIATTAVLLAVFVPTAMMPGLTGRLYQQFAITISIATVFSSVNALTLSPALAGMLLRPSPEKRGKIFTKFNDLPRDGHRALFGRRQQDGPKGWGDDAGLRRHHRRHMAWPYAAAVGLHPGRGSGLLLRQCAASGRGLDGADRREVLDRINEVLSRTPGVEHYITIGGYSFLNSVQGSNYGAIIATLENWSERDEETHAASLIANLQGFMLSIQEGIAIAFGPPPITGLGAASGFTMEMQDRGGVGLQALETLAKDMVAAGNQSEVVTRLNQNFSASVPQIFIDVDRNRTKAYEVPLQTVFNTLQANLGSAYVNDFNLFGRTWKVMVQADQDFRSRVSDIERLEVRNARGNMIPVGTLARGAGHGWAAGDHPVQHVPHRHAQRGSRLRLLVRTGGGGDGGGSRPSVCPARWATSGRGSPSSRSPPAISLR